MLLRLDPELSALVNNELERELKLSQPIRLGLGLLMNMIDDNSVNFGIVMFYLFSLSLSLVLFFFFGCIYGDFFLTFLLLIWKYYFNKTCLVYMPFGVNIIIFFYNFLIIILSEFNYFSNVVTLFFFLLTLWLSRTAHPKEVNSFQ